MKKLTIIILLFLPFFLYGQGMNVMHTSNKTRVVAPAGPSYSTEYQAVYDALTTKPDATTAGYQDDLVTSLVSGGYWARMDFLLVFAQTTNSGGEALVEWKSPGTITTTTYNAISFTANQGFTSAGNIEDSISIGKTLNTCTNFTVNDATIGAYLRLNISDGGYVHYATDASSNAVYLRPNSGGTFNGSMNQNTGNQSAGGITNPQGLWLSVRESSSQTRTYLNATEVDADADGSNAVPATPLKLLFLSAHQISIVFAMDQCSQADATALTTIFETYMDAIGTGVIP